MHFRPVKLQGVRLNQLKCLRENASQPGGKITVNLNRRFVSALRDDFTGERRLSRADFNQHLLRLGIDRIDNFSDPMQVIEEVLPKALAGVMTFKFLHHCGSFL